MGTSWSASESGRHEVPQRSRDILQLASNELTEHEKYCLRRRNLAESNLGESLGLAAYPSGASIVLRSALFIARWPDEESVQIVPRIMKVITFFNGRLSRCLNLDNDEHTKLLFLSVAAKQAIPSSEPGELDQWYISFNDILALLTLLVAAFDTGRGRALNIETNPENTKIAGLMLAGLKSPIMRYDSFKALMKAYPGMLEVLSKIWDQLLYELGLSVPQDELVATSKIPRNLRVELAFTVGENFLSALQLYNGRRDGYSMRAFELATTKWRAPSILIVRGYTVSQKLGDLDAYVPKAYDVPLRHAKNLAVAVYVENQWTISAKKCFAAPGTTKVMLLAPELSLFRTDDVEKTVFLTPKVGIGAGFSPPQGLTAPRHTPSVAFMIDSEFAHGVLRIMPKSSVMEGGYYNILDSTTCGDFRFSVSDVEVYGLGTEETLAASRNAWVVEEDQTTQRSKRLNQHGNSEDRAILELAGLVGQYTTSNSGGY